MLPEFSQTTWYRVLYFIFLCQAFLQETRSHMIYHVIKGDWGRFPQQARGWRLLAIRALLAILKTLRGDCQKREERKRKGYTNKFGDE